MSQNIAVSDLHIVLIIILHITLHKASTNHALAQIKTKATLSISNSTVE